MTRRQLATILFLLVTAIIAFALAIGCGQSGCESGWGPVNTEIRLPRALAGFVTGALLSLAGVLMQLLLRNPLADPYVLGVSGGAAVGAMLGSMLMPATLAFFGLQIGALAGAALATALLFILARRSLATSPLPYTIPGISLILTGVMISAGFGALISLLLSFSPDSQLRGALFWLMGDLDVDSYGWPAWIVLFVTATWSVKNSSQLNVLAHGEVTAQLLGLPVRRLRIMLLIVASAATAAAVSLAGAIGFIGLVVPHALRLAIGNDQRLLMPASMLAGGSALVIADLLSRTLVAPIQLPVGVITSLVGVPVFLSMLAGRR